MSSRQSYSQEQLELINIGIQKGIPLLAISQSDEFLAASKDRREFLAKEKASFPMEGYLAHGHDGPFVSREEREAAMAVRTTDDRGKSVLLYDFSPAYRQAVQYKMEQSSPEVCGLYVKPDPLSPQALIDAAEEDLYHAKRTELFDRAGGKDPVKAAEARLEILKLGTDPAWAPIREKFERTEAETKPLETALKETGPWIVNTFPQGTPEAMEAEATRRDNEQYGTRPGGVGDGGVSGPSNTTFK